MEVGDPVELVAGWRDLSGKGPLLVLVKQGANTLNYESLREHLNDLQVEALIVPEDLLADVRQLSPLVIEDLQRALAAIRTPLTPQDPLPAIGPTPERVVAALRKRPELLEGVRRLLAG